MKIYADTSVFGGVFDEQFAEASRKFFDEVADGRYALVISAAVQNEIDGGAPDEVRKFFEDTAGATQAVKLTPDIVRLRNAYLDAGIVTEKSIEDAAHVAAATVSGCRAIVSWNFKHIVHFDKIRQYNTVNELNGYNRIDIFSPMSVIDYDDS